MAPRKKLYSATSGHGRRLLRIPHERDFAVIRLLPDAGGSFVDVGANHGQSIESILLYKRDAHIVSFEANPALGVRLKDRYRGNDGIVVHSVGIGEEPGHFTLYVPIYNEFVYDGLASLDRDEAAGWLNPDTLYGFDRSKLELAEIVCEVRTLDEFALAPSFIKIDVQGLEYAVIRGGMQTIRAHRPALLIEGYSNDVRLAPLLSDLGYREYRYAGGRLVPGSSRGANSLLLARRA